MAPKAIASANSANPARTDAEPGMDSSIATFDELLGNACGDLREDPSDRPQPPIEDCKCTFMFLRLARRPVGRRSRSSVRRRISLRSRDGSRGCLKLTGRQTTRYGDYTARLAV